MHKTKPCTDNVRGFALDKGTEAMNIQTLIDDTAQAIGELKDHAAQPLPRGICAVLSRFTSDHAYIVRRTVNAATGHGNFLSDLCYGAFDKLDLQLLDPSDPERGLDSYCVKGHDLEALLNYAIDHELSSYYSLPNINCERNEIAFDAHDTLSDWTTGRLLPEYEEGQPDALPDDVRKELQCFAERRRKVYRHCIGVLESWLETLKRIQREQADEELA